MLIVVFLPNITNDVVPLFEGISIGLEVGMLAPSLEVLNALQAFREAVNHTLDVLVGAWLHLQPVLLDARDN